MDIDTTIEQLGDEFAFFYGVLKPLILELDLDPDAEILDVGTGMGRLAISLALHGYRVRTGEPAGDDSEYAKQPWRADAEKAGVTDRIAYEPFDAQQMPFADDLFDAMFVVGALHHIPDPAAAFAEMRRTLKASGVLCILEPNAALLAKVRQRHPTHPEPADPTPFGEGMSLEHKALELFDIYLFRPDK